MIPIRATGLTANLKVRVKPALTKEDQVYSLLTATVAAAQVEERRRRAATLRLARAHKPGVRWFRKPANERVAQSGDVGQPLTSAPCMNRG